MVLDAALLILLVMCACSLFSLSLQLSSLHGEMDGMTVLSWCRVEQQSVEWYNRDQ